MTHSNALVDYARTCESITQLCEVEGAGIASVAEVVEQDPRLRDVVMRTANSIQNLLPRPTRTVRHAILVLGLGRVRSLVEGELELTRRRALLAGIRLDPPHSRLDGPHSAGTSEGFGDGSDGNHADDVHVVRRLPTPHSP